MSPTRAQTIKIHIAIKEIPLTDEIYRDILYMAFNVKSSKSLRSHQAEKLLDILKAKGWTQKSKKSKDFSKTYPEVNMRKIQAIWITMEKAGIIKKRGDLAMNKNVRRMTKKENLNWCDADDCRLLIESLKSWARREKVELDH